MNLALYIPIGILIILYINYIGSINSFEWLNVLHNPRNIIRSINYHKSSLTISLIINTILLGGIIAYGYYLKNSYHILNELMIIIQNPSNNPIFLVLSALGIFFLWEMFFKQLLIKNTVQERVDKKHAEKGKLSDFFETRVSPPLSINAIITGEQWWWLSFSILFIIFPLFGLYPLLEYNNGEWIIKSAPLICSILLFFAYKDYHIKLAIMLLYIPLLYIPTLILGESFIQPIVSAWHIIFNHYYFHLAQLIIFGILILLITLSVFTVLVSYLYSFLSPQEYSEEEQECQDFLFHHKVWLGYNMKFLSNYYRSYGAYKTLPKTNKIFFKHIAIFFGKDITRKIINIGYFFRHDSTIIDPYIGNTKNMTFSPVKRDVYFYLLKNNYTGSTMSILYVFYITGLITLFGFPFMFLIFLPMYIALDFSIIVLLYNLVPFFIVFWIAFCFYIEWNKFVYLQKEKPEMILYPLLKELLYQEQNEFYDLTTKQQITYAYYQFPAFDIEYMRTLLETYNPQIYNKFRQRFPHQKKYIDISEYTYT